MLNKKFLRKTAVAGIAAAACWGGAASAQVPVLPPVMPSPHMTLWRFLGIPQGGQRLWDARANANGNRPGLERLPPLKRIADPENLLSDNPAIKKAAEVKQQEDLKKQKIKAIKYLGTIACGCYKGVKEALLAALDDCTEEVRYEAAKALVEAAGNKCKTCNSESCCSKEVLEKLTKVAYDRDDAGCFKEASQRVRDMAIQGIKACTRPAPPDAYPIDAVVTPVVDPVNPVDPKTGEGIKKAPEDAAPLPEGSAPASPPPTPQAQAPTIRSQQAGPVMQAPDLPEVSATPSLQPQVETSDATPAKKGKTLFGALAGLTSGGPKLAAPAAKSEPAAVKQYVVRTETVAAAPQVEAPMTAESAMEVLAPREGSSSVAKIERAPEPAAPVFMKMPAPVAKIPAPVVAKASVPAPAPVAPQVKAPAAAWAAAAAEKTAPVAAAAPVRQAPRTPAMNQLSNLLQNSPTPLPAAQTRQTTVKSTAPALLPQETAQTKASPIVTGPVVRSTAPRTVSRASAEVVVESAAPAPVRSTAPVAAPAAVPSNGPRPVVGGPVAPIRAKRPVGSTVSPVSAQQDVE